MDIIKNNSHILRMQTIGLIAIVVTLKFFIICFFDFFKVFLLQSLNIPMDCPLSHEVSKKKKDLVNISPKRAQSIHVFIKIAGEIRPGDMTNYWRTA